MIGIPQGRWVGLSNVVVSIWSGHTFLGCILLCLHWVVHQQSEIIGAQIGTIDCMIFV